MLHVLHSAIVAGEKSDLIALRRKWYAILADEGFEDIETLTNKGNLYSCINKRRDKPVDTDENKIKAEYHRAASQFLYDHIFPDWLSCRVWELHANGVPYRKIMERFGISARKAHGIVSEIVQGPFKEYRERLDKIDPDDSEQLFERNEKECHLKKVGKRQAEDPRAAQTKLRWPDWKCSKPHPKTLLQSFAKTRSNRSNKSRRISRA